MIAEPYRIWEITITIIIIFLSILSLIRAYIRQQEIRIKNVSKERKKIMFLQGLTKDLFPVLIVVLLWIAGELLRDFIL